MDPLPLLTQCIFINTILFILAFGVENLLLFLYIFAFYELLKYGVFTTIYLFDYSEI